MKTHLHWDAADSTVLGTMCLVQIFSRRKTAAGIIQKANFALSQCQDQWRKTQVSFIHPLDTVHRPQMYASDLPKDLLWVIVKYASARGKRNDKKATALLCMFSGFQLWQRDKRNSLNVSPPSWDWKFSTLVFLKQTDHLLFLSDVFVLELYVSVCCKEYNKSNENFHFCHSRWKRKC